VFFRLATWSKLSFKIKNTKTNISKNIFAAQAQYALKKSELASGVLSEGDTLTTLGTGELTFTTIKNESATVFGYFRNYFGIAKIRENQIEEVAFIIDVNSLDTAVPGRNNRILDIFFQSFKPELGAATIQFDSFDAQKPLLSAYQEGKAFALRATGLIDLNGTSKKIAANLILQRQGDLWSVKTEHPISLYLSDFNFGNRIYDLMKECNHKSIGNKVEINVDFTFK